MKKFDILLVMNEETRQMLLLEADRIENLGDTKTSDLLRAALVKARIDETVEEGKVFQVDMGRPACSVEIRLSKPMDQGKYVAFSYYNR